MISHGSNNSVSLAVERALVGQGHSIVAGVDEVGRGAVAGPVSVGVTAIDFSSPVEPFPAGLADSKALSARAREELIEPIRAWASTYAVGHASAHEIDEVGIMAALGLAGRRALVAAAKLLQEKLRLPDPKPFTVVILDGNFDWLSTGTFEEPLQMPLVHLLKGGDRLSATVAAASVLAKVTRDSIMGELAATEPRYEWQKNKGYASLHHRQAMQDIGLSSQHRRSWRLLPE